MILLQILVVFAAAVTAFYCICCISRMTPKTNHGIRAAYILIAVGAAAEVQAIFEGHIPGIGETLFVVGCGLLDFVDRRCSVRRSLLPRECNCDHH